MTTLTLTKTTATDPFRCPSWCVINHEGEDPSDSFHRSEYTEVQVPAGALLSGEPRALLTELVVHTVDPQQSCLSIGTIDDGFELSTVEAVDEYLRNLTDHLFQVRAMRDELADGQGRA